MFQPTSIFSRIIKSPEHFAIWYCKNTHCTECMALSEGFECTVFEDQRSELSSPDINDVNKVAIYKFIIGNTGKYLYGVE